MQYTITRDDVEYPITVEYTAHKAIRGARERGGLQIEPDEPAHIEIDGIEGVDFELTDDEISEIETYIGEVLADREADYDDSND